MAWLLKRVFDIDREHCPQCGGTLKIIAAISLQCEHHLPGTVESKAFVGNGGTGDIAAQVLTLLALMGGTAHLGMQAKAGDDL